MKVSMPVIGESVKSIKASEPVIGKSIKSMKASEPVIGEFIKSIKAREPVLGDRDGNKKKTPFRGPAGAADKKSVFFFLFIKIVVCQCFLHL